MEVLCTYPTSSFPEEFSDLGFSTDSLVGTKLNETLPRPIPSHLVAHLSHCGVKKQCSPANATQPAHASRAALPISTYVVSRKDPSLHLSSAFLAAGFPENSTMPFPEDRPLSSTITTALSTWPNTEKASSRSSLDTNWGRFLTVSEALWQAKRTRSCFPRRGMLSSSTLAISARVRVSCR